MDQETSIPQVPVRLSVFNLVLAAIVALLLCMTAVWAMTYRHMSSEHQRSLEHALAVKHVSMRVLAAQNCNINADPKSINHDLVVLGLSSADIGQRPDTLAPFGIKTKDIRQEPTMTVTRRSRTKMTDTD
jgi:hypothetical protein